MAKPKYNTPEDQVTFNLIDKYTVDRLRRDGDIKLPARKLDVAKDERWNSKQMASKLLQGILNGSSIPTIAESILSVVGNNKSSAIRNARTMTTNAENHGRLDSYNNLAKQGVVQKKVWIATPDDRTRESHIDVDGEEVDIDKAFSNGCMFPGDPKAPGEEVWNCRCTMRDHIIGFRRKDGSISRVEYGRDETTHDRQMSELKNRNAKRSSIIDKTYQSFINNVSKEGLKYIAVNDLDKPLTNSQIINKIGKDDNTGGSCASVALSYCANKVGLDVTDFRGGNSKEFFSEHYYKAIKLADADIKTYKVKKEVSEVTDIISNIETNKEFVLSAGRHITIIKRTERGGFYYLELQGDQESNGWIKVGKDRDEIERVLKERFRCRKTVRRNSKTGKPTRSSILLIDVDSFKKTDEFKDILGYLNTKS